MSKSAEGRAPVASKLVAITVLLTLSVSVLAEAPTQVFITGMLGPGGEVLVFAEGQEGVQDLLLIDASLQPKVIKRFPGSESRRNIMPGSTRTTVHVVQMDKRAWKYFAFRLADSGGYVEHNCSFPSFKPELLLSSSAPVLIYGRKYGESIHEAEHSRSVRGLALVDSCTCDVDAELGMSSPTFSSYNMDSASISDGHFIVPFNDSKKPRDSYALVFTLDTFTKKCRLAIPGRVLDTALVASQGSYALAYVKDRQTIVVTGSFINRDKKPSQVMIFEAKDAVDTIVLGKKKFVAMGRNFFEVWTYAPSRICSHDWQTPPDWTWISSTGKHWMAVFGNRIATGTCLKNCAPSEQSFTLKWVDGSWRCE